LQILRFHDLHISPELEDFHLHLAEVRDREGEVFPVDFRALLLCLVRAAIPEAMAILFRSFRKA
jgi:hypothetical protein